MFTLRRGFPNKYDDVERLPPSKCPSALKGIRYANRWPSFVWGVHSAYRHYLNVPVFESIQRCYFYSICKWYKGELGSSFGFLLKSTVSANSKKSLPQVNLPWPLHKWDIYYLLLLSLGVSSSLRFLSHSAVVFKVSLRLFRCVLRTTLYIHIILTLALCLIVW